MLDASKIDFLISIINSLVTRTPLIMEIQDTTDDAAIRDLLALIPAHRYLLAAGAVPKWVRHMEGKPRVIPNATPEELAVTFLSSLNEERAGSRPIQFIHFDAGPETYRVVLRNLPIGWIATTTELDQITREFPTDQKFYVTKGPHSASLVHMREKPEDTRFEQELLKRARAASPTALNYLIQKKYSEMWLAGASIRRDIEEVGTITSLPDVEEQFELDEQTIRKMFELVFAEQGIDIREYIQLPDKDVVSVVENLSRLDHAIAVGAVQGESVIHVKKLRYSELSLLSIFRQTGRVFVKMSANSFVGERTHMSATFPDGSKIVAFRNAKIIYVALFAKEAKTALSVSEAQSVLSNLVP